METRLALFLIVSIAAPQLSAPAAPAPVPGPESSGSPRAIPWRAIGTAAGAQYSGDGLKVTPTEQGVRVHCAFQHLDGLATREGLWLTSTLPNPPDQFRLKAVAVEHKYKAGSSLLEELPAAGRVLVEGQTVRFTRPRLVEEYSVSMHGVQQDFLVLEKPGGARVHACPLVDRLGQQTDVELRVELAVTGARVQQTAYGAQLVLEQSGRRITYSRLKATDASGKELPSRMEPASRSGITNQKPGIGLSLVVDDDGAVYPVRIDPTFSDANWGSLGGIRGANYPINAAVVDDAGNLYIGGSFTEVGDAVVNYIAKWNGSSWSALGSGMNGSVLALAVSGSNLYAGGYFTMAGGVGATNVAQWDGNAWSAMGLGVTGSNGDPSNPPMVLALAVSGSDVYAGGNFTNVGGSSPSYIAKWNGSAWSAMSSGMNSTVSALAVSGSDVFAGGDFTTAGGITANHIAKWDGSTWSALGSGMGGAMPYTSGGVSALAASGSNLYAGGFFTTAGGIPATTIAKWDGTAWSALGSGTGGASFPASAVTALAVSGNDVYAGWTTNVLCAAGGCGGGGGAIAKWDGSVWSTLALEPSIWEVGNIITPAVYALAASGSNVFVGGNFITVGGVAANYVAKWNGSNWNALGSGLNSSVSALAVSGTGLCAGGGFTTAGSIAANYIAQWDGRAWSPLGSGMNGGVSALAVSGSNVYAGGSFTTAGGNPATNIAQWDGSAWRALGAGMNSTVSALAVSGSDVYAGGYFTTAGGIAANAIAKWDGNSWSALGSGMAGAYGYVNALAVSGSNLYAGGRFTTAGGSPANYIARWDGNTWSALGSGLSDTVVALAVSGSNVYAGGYFTGAGGSPANYIAKWDGTVWKALGSGMNSTVYALAVSGSDVYAGGYFTTAGGIAANAIAKWDGTTWSALGSGISGAASSVYALAVSGGDLYAGGSFTTAGGKASAYAAKATIGPPPFYFVTTSSRIGLRNGQFYVTLVGPAGSNAVIFASTNLQTWSPLVTNPLTSGSLNFTDTFATNFTHRFYRALLQP